MVGLLVLCCLVGASHALAGVPVPHMASIATPGHTAADVRGAAYLPSDGLGPTPIVCLFRSHGTCRLNRLVGTIAAWPGVEQCGVVSALSELRMRPGLCQFFGVETGTRRREHTGVRSDAGRTL